MKPRPRRLAFLAPEVVQTSAMDCGPATLKSLLEGFGVPVSYGRLREACQIDLDGTSIDTMEEVAVQLGLGAEQVMVPADHLLMPEAGCLPAIVVVRHTNGLAHFVVVWRRLGPFVQVMDPSTGRRWTTLRQLQNELYVHEMAVPADAWREWAGSAEFLGVLRARLAGLRIPPDEAGETIRSALADPGWRSLAALDAGVRMVRALVEAGGLARGREAGRLLGSLLARCREDPAAAESVISATWWSARPAPPAPEGGERVMFRGAVLVRVRGDGVPMDPAALSPELLAALSEPPTRPGRELLRLMIADGLFAPGAIALALAVAGLGVIVETLLFRAFFDLGRELGLGLQRAVALGLLFAVVALFLLLDLPIARGTLRLGRRLEARLRMAFLRKIPRLGDRYFQSRLTSDMAARSHSVHRLRLVADFGEAFLRTAFELLFTLAGIVWLDPHSLPLAVTAGAVTLGLPILLTPRLRDRDLRVHTHAGALSRFYLDAFLGLFPIRTHGAQKAVRRQHEGLLVDWGRAVLGFKRTEVATDATVGLVMFLMVVALLFDHLRRQGLDASVLLLVYWGLKVLTLGPLLILSIAVQYPSHRNVALRLLEPLGAPEEMDETAAPSPPAAGSGRDGRGVGIVWRGVSVHAGGHTILDGIDVEIAPGDHVAIVGPSGAGKSSLVGTLLGWHRPAAGQLLADGRPAAGEQLQALRRETAWVDPAVQIWNRSLLHNLRYGAAGDTGLPVDHAVRQADLLAVLRKLPGGLQTSLGEGGGLVSGGEGQRVRFARALLRHDVRLVILDEPFRGLDREQRRELLARARRLWREPTLLCITHDVGETLDFGRVLVIEHGRIVEDGAPACLAQQPGSRYSALLAAERDVREGLWENPVWRRLHMERGRLTEQPSEGGPR